MRWATPEEAGLDAAAVQALHARLLAAVADRNVLGAAAGLMLQGAVVGLWAEGERAPGVPLTIATRFALPETLAHVLEGERFCEPDRRTAPELALEAERGGPLASVMDLLQWAERRLQAAVPPVPASLRADDSLVLAPVASSTLRMDAAAHGALAVLVTGPRSAQGPRTATVTVRVSSVPFGPEHTFRMEVAHGSTLLRAAASVGAPLRFACVRGDCAKCRVDVTWGRENLAPPTRAEQAILGERGLAAGARLGCQARVAGPVSFQQGV